MGDLGGGGGALSDYSSDCNLGSSSGLQQRFEGIYKYSDGQINETAILIVVSLWTLVACGKEEWGKRAPIAFQPIIGHIL